MAKITMMISSANERIDLPRPKDGLVSHSSPSIGFDTIPRANHDATIILGLVAVVSNVETIAIVGVANSAQTELEVVVARVVSEVKEEHLLTAAFLLQPKAALSTTGIGIYIHGCDIQIRVGLGDDVELCVIGVVDPPDIKFL